MMHKWEFADGTVVRWTSKGSVLVDGTSALANDIRGDLNRIEYEPCQILVIPPPGGCVDLDLSSVWIVNEWLKWRGEEFRSIKIVSSTYMPKDEDMPPEAAELVQRARAWKPLPYGYVT